MKKIMDLELLRGGGILLVVFAHISYHYNVVFLQYLAIFFAMPLFFCISGFLFGYNDISKLNTWKGYKKFLVNKGISLGIPYIIFSIIYIILFFLMSKYVDTNNFYELKDIFFIMFSPVAQYWYLWTLLVFLLVSSFVIRENNFKLLLLIAVFANIIWHIFFSDTDLTVYTKTIVWYMYFVGAAYLGQLYATGKYFILAGKRTQFILGFLEILFILTSLLRVSNNGVAGVVASILQFVNTICGIFGFWFVMHNISRVSIFKRAIFVIANYSWYIYILHSYFTSVSKTLLIRILPNIDIYSYFVISFLFTIIGCILIGYFSKKIAFIDFLFYPQKYLRLYGDI